MRKIMALTLFACLSASWSLAETIDHPRDFQEESRIHQRAQKRWMWSTVALVAASFADAHSSWGKLESNPALRSGNGTFGAKGLAFKMGMVGGIVAGQHFMLRHNPRLAPAASWVNFGVAGVKAGVAARNYQIQKPSYLLK